MSTKMNLIFFKTPSDDKIILDLSGISLSPKDYEFIINHDVKSFIRQIPVLENGIILFYINKKSDLLESVLLLKALAKFPHAKMFKFFTVLTYDYIQSESVLKKWGCLGFYTPAERSERIAKRIDKLRLRMLPHLKPVNEILDQNLVFDSVINEQKKDDSFAVEYTPAIKLESDIWIINPENNYEKLQDVVRVSMIGPSTHVGKWKSAKASSDGNTLWRYDFQESMEDVFIPAGGSWFYSGEKPSFDWKEKSWTFRSQAPHLYFKKVTKETFTKFHFENNVLALSENTEDALAKKELILASATPVLDEIKFANLINDYRESKMTKDISFESGSLSVDIVHEKNQVEMTENCELEDFHEKEIIVISKPGRIPQRSMIKATVSLDYAGESVGVNCVGVVTEVEKQSDVDYVTIGVATYDKEDYSKFINLYLRRQNNINQFMKLAKGY